MTRFASLRALVSASARQTAALGLLGAACTGNVLGDLGNGPAPGAPEMAPNAAGQANQGPLPTEPMGATVLHRLNRVELENTVRQLFGEQASRAIDETIDPRVQGFDSNADALTISESGVDSRMRMAGEIAAGVELSQLLPCEQSSGSTCAAERFAAIAPRILRRPPTAAETESYLSLWQSVAGRTDEDTAMRAVLQRLLMTPDFLYHVQWGDDAGLLNAFELASRLSFFFWETTPDDELLAAAQSGALLEPAGFEGAVDRLLDDARGQATLTRFFEQWVELDKLDDLVKDTAAYPEFAQLKVPMQDEFRAFVGTLVAGQGTVAELFTSTRTFVTAELAAFYGLTVSGQGLQPVQLPADERAGFLTQAAFLTTHAKANKSSPILRGRFIREQVLCAPVPPPPPGANNVEAAAPVATTTRAYYETLTAGAACSGCHSQLNPVGFAFEGFDGLGRTRTEENGYPVDTSGTITAGDQAGPVNGALELSARLGQSHDVRVCLARQVFRSRFRRVEVGGDHELITQAAAALSGQGDRITALARLLAGSEAMKYRHFRIATATEVGK